MDLIQGSICHQSKLEIVKDKVTQNIYICCDECEGEWATVEDAIKSINGSRGKYGEMQYPTKAEKASIGWDAYIKQFRYTLWNLLICTILLCTKSYL